MTKQKCPEYYIKSKNASETCRIFDCSSRSLMGWVKKYQTTQSIEQMLRIK